MQPSDPLSIDLRGIGASHVLFDIVPKPDVTPLMRQAQSFGARTIGGKRMVEGQARAIAEFFGYRI
jgi:shikimate dehydrogenase